MYPKISIVTPNYNQAKYIEFTIQSVLSQNYPNLEYIIIDGGSTDGSVEIIKKYESQLTYWVSEKDYGIYDALNKGFKKSTGDVMGWINSDDLLLDNALFKIARVFSENTSVEWFEGINTIIDSKGAVQSAKRPPVRNYLRYLSKVAFNNPGFCFIQQESTYWRRDLWVRSGNEISLNYKLAGDFELWMRFFNNAELVYLNTTIGAFRYTGSEQLSVGNYQQYMNEANQIVNIHTDKSDFFKKMKIMASRQCFILLKKLSLKRFKPQYLFDKLIFVQKTIELR